VFGTPVGLFYWIWNLIKNFGVRKLEFCAIVRCCFSDAMLPTRLELPLVMDARRTDGHRTIACLFNCFVIHHSGKFLIRRLHDTTGCTTGWTTGCIG